MDDSTVQVNPDPFETIESLARTVAHLALQLTISQIQLRAMGSAIEEADIVASDAVGRRHREDRARQCRPVPARKPRDRS